MKKALLGCTENIIFAVALLGLSCAVLLAEDVEYTVTWKVVIRDMIDCPGNYPGVDVYSEEAEPVMLVTSLLCYSVKEKVMRRKFSSRAEAEEFIEYKPENNIFRQYLNFKIEGDSGGQGE